jgi:sulfopyruvate decarboxylase TPP-binding subunit
MMLDGSAVVEALQTCGITHAVWIPDSLIGRWEGALSEASSLRLIRATREGEAIAIAGGLMLGGARPLVLIQCTGLFEAGDALRNIVHDLKLPLIMIVGVRSYRAFQAGKSWDSCPAFTEPILKTWQIPTTWLDPEKDTSGDFIAAIRKAQLSGKAAAILLVE